MNVSLVIMAAGLGSRYGGNKQTDGIGPNGEFLMEYAVYDALEAGFNRVVFVIKPGMEELIDRMCGRYLRGRTARDGKSVEVSYAYQDYSSLPEWFTPPEGRTKPYGTVHALLCAEALVDGPFCVLNADDYYGADAYRAIYEQLTRLPASGRALMVGYRLKNTASLHGSVCRGLCDVEDGMLKRVRETKHIQLYENGIVEDLETHIHLDPETPVSMNYWGFAPSIFPVLRTYLEDFLRSRARSGTPSACCR